MGSDPSLSKGYSSPLASPRLSPRAHTHGYVVSPRLSESERVGVFAQRPGLQASDEIFAKLRDKQSTQYAEEVLAEEVVSLQVQDRLRKHSLREEQQFQQIQDRLREGRRHGRVDSGGSLRVPARGSSPVATSPRPGGASGRRAAPLLRWK